MDNQIPKGLTYLDLEYENPIVKNIVQSLIQKEIQDGSKNDVLVEDRKRKILNDNPFSRSNALQDEFKRVQRGIALQSIDNKKYQIEAPTGALENDVQAWLRCISCAKSQYVYQEDRLLNLEMMELYSPNQWLEQNASVEKQIERIKSQTELNHKKIRNVSNQMRINQQKAASNLMRLKNKSQEILIKTFHIQRACHDMESSLMKSGHNFQEYLEAKLKKESEVIDDNDAIHNATVNEYETVHIREMDSDIPIEKDV